HPSRRPFISTTYPAANKRASSIILFVSRNERSCIFGACAAGMIFIIPPLFPIHSTYYQLMPNVNELSPAEPFEKKTFNFNRVIVLLFCRLFGLVRCGLVGFFG